MNLIDKDALMEILTTAIRNMKGMAKFLDAEDDPEIQMEIKAYTDIANGVNDMPTIEERKKGKWIEFPNHYAYKCSECGRIIETVDGKSNVCKHYPYCHCGAKMEEGEQP